MGVGENILGSAGREGDAERKTEGQERQKERDRERLEEAEERRQ